MEAKGFRITAAGSCSVLYSAHEPEAVKIAAENLKEDLKKVFRGNAIAEDPDGSERGKSPVEIRIHTLSADGEDEKKGFFPAACYEKNGRLRKEAYCLAVRQGVLYITGADRRGTVYGIYELSEMLGVSPWYFFADVPVKKKEAFALPEGYEKFDYPSVEYRGIFINDEEELEAWVKNRMGEETIGVKTYEKIFELLLRLKANYIWPAMHVNSFNVKRENGALAERMGIVVGTSHCDMLMRSNNREWKPWLAEKGYEKVEYDYSLEGRNREILQEYWRESVEQNREFEVCYTLGMRGIHDSGFETRALEGLSGEALKAKKIELLQRIMEDQRDILQGTLGKTPLMTFVPYKEVLPLYDGGLQVPEDITLVWSNDNYGYIRRYPSGAEKKRKGGNGIYYHNSYWAPPGMSYVFLCSIPLAHTANELRKAYEEGIRRLWVINTGAMKPLEQEIEFFVRLAWDIGKENESTADVETYVEKWIDSNFSGGIGRETAGLLNDFSQLTNVRKLEMMEQNVFSQTAYGDEAVARIHEYERLFQAGNRIYEGLPEEEKPAFFQLVLMRIHAAYFTNLAYYYGDRSTLAVGRGRAKAAALYAKKVRQLEDVRRRMLVYYNKVMLEGKWDGILNPEGFPPPRAAMMPVYTPPLVMPEGKPKLDVSLWNEEEELTFVRPGTKWFEIGNAGGGSLRFFVQAPDWLKLSERAGETETETRVLVTVDSVQEEKRGFICITETNTGEQVEIPVLAAGAGGVSTCSAARKDAGESTYAVCEGIEETLPCEDGGVVWVRADSALKLPEGFRRIKRLGRGGGDLIEVCAEHAAGAIGYRVLLNSSGEALLELHRFPSLNSVGRIRIGVSVDGGPMQVLESESRDEHLGNWRDNVRNHVDRLYIKFPFLEAGEHTVAFHAMDKYVAFGGFAIYTRERRENNLVGAALAGEQGLPEYFDSEAFAEHFYGKIALLPRAIEYAQTQKETDTLVVSDLIVQEGAYAAPVVPGYYLQLGASPFGEREGHICIDAAAALANSPCAFAEGSGWAYCGSESYGRSGLAMYLPGKVEPGDCELTAPSLQYKIQCSGGLYTIWLLSKFAMREESFFGVGVDGNCLPVEALYGKGCLWRYEAEQIYRWVPLTKQQLAEGEHHLALYSLGTGLRFDRIYLTKGEELPPGDLQWGSRKV